MIIVDFRDFGPVAPRPVTATELDQFLSGCLILLDQFDSDTITELLDDWTVSLMWDSIREDAVDDTWYDRAFIVLCCRGLRGELRPKFLNFS